MWISNNLLYQCAIKKIYNDKSALAELLADLNGIDIALRKQMCSRIINLTLNSWVSEAESCTIAANNLSENQLPANIKYLSSKAN
ncbi:unnamed protein product [Blepharisma stoltei]|uniref:Uncharacterized protein n=1 Tax=Blepharisma stoltei TaxID=1481888 RepID=A0AAU9J052_9CILI|nr:unnamed protein product [Blepharisma stoltei]